MIRNLFWIYLICPGILICQDQSKKKYFHKYSPEVRDLICANWGQFFKEDLISPLNSTLQVFPIKLDSYGSFYPVKEIINVIDEEDFTYQDRNEVDMFKYSLYETALLNKDEIKKAASKLNDTVKEAYMNIINDLEVEEDYEKYTVKSIDKFYKNWDDYHFASEMKRLKEKLKEGYTHVLFFIHGYNVPYALANVQTVELAALINDLQEKGKVPKEQKILYVPVFWPSNDQKYCALGDNVTFNTDNNKGLFNGGPYNGFRFLYYSNRAYYAAITLRKILNELGKVKNIKVNVFSHSLGAIVASSALINTYTKLQSNYVYFIKHYTGVSQADKDSLILLRDNDPITYDIFTSTRSNPTPTLALKVFLSAPAMPGVDTFTDMTTNSTNVRYYSTINENDEMLTKSAIKLFGMHLPINAAIFNSTTLGCDYNKNEVKGTASVFKSKHGNASCFISKNVSDKTDHDILTYIQQENYIDFITRFLTD